MDTDQQIKRNCCGEYGVKYRYTIGTTEFYQCPVSVYVFDPDVIDVIDLVLTSLESGIPVTGTCLLDQTKKFFEFTRIIRDERKDCFEELEKVRERERKSASNRAQMQNKPRAPRRRQK